MESEHNPPHIHAFYGDDAATFYISNGEIYEGSFPNRAKKMVKEFVLKYQKRTVGHVGNRQVYETERT